MELNLFNSMFYEHPYLLSVNTSGEYCSNSLITNITSASSNADFYERRIDTYNRQILEHYDKVNKSKDIKLIRSKKTLLITSI